MSVDFSQFFNGPIRDSLIAQVSGYLDIPRPQATIAYDKAVALVIGAMARQAGKPEGAQELAAHIRDSQTQASLTSSALSPTVLTNDQFAQIVTVGEREQGTILGAQLEPVASHLEVATGLDRTAVGSLLSVIVPFVLSYLKNNITTETTAADKLPALLAAQAPHVAPQLDAPALAALGGERLEDVFGPDVNGSADAHSAPAAAQDRGASSSSANANERTKGGWFKWVLTLAVILAGVAWVKSCTQSDTPVTENAEPATQDQSATPVPAPETAPAEAPPAEAPPAEAAPTESQSPAAEGDAPASDADAAGNQGGADAPAAHFPEPAPAPNSDTSPAPVKNSTPAASTDNAASTPATQASAAPEETGADTSADKSAANTNEAATAATAADNPASASETGSDQTNSDQPAGQTDDGKNATDSAPEAAHSGHTEDSTTTEPTSGPASDSMEAESAPTGESDAGADATTPATQSNQSAAPTADTESAGKTTTFTDATATEATAAANAADSSAADSSAATPVEAGGKTTTFAAPAESAADGGQARVAPQGPSTPADQNESQATHGDASASTSTSEAGVPGKTTTFGEAVQSPGSTDASAPAAETTSPADTSAASDQPAQLRLQREGDALKVSGTVSNESVHSRIVNALKLVDGHSRIEDDVKIDPQATAMAFDDYSGLLSLLRGYHDVNMNLENDALTLTGQVTSQEEKDTLTSRAQSLVGSSIQVHNQAEVVAPTQTNGGAAVPAQVLFASGSADVDDRFHDALDQLAQRLNDNGKRVRLVGFADESGSTPLNEVLSKRRAESVKAYLILRGVPADRIQTEGQGVQAPVADNATREGRAQNRRVEFHEE